MGELIGIGIAVVAFAGVAWLCVLANRSIRRQRGSMMKRSHEEKQSIRESRYRMGGGSGGGLG